MVQITSSTEATDMTQENKQIHVLLHNQLDVYSSSWLSDFIEAAPGESYIRDACTKKYLACNTAMIHGCGLESANDCIGLTPAELWLEDITHRRERLCLDNAVICSEEIEAKRIEQLDSRMQSDYSALHIHRVVLNFKGFVEFNKVTLLSIPDHLHKKALLFLRLSQDLTSQLNLPDLFQLYRKYYPDIQAIQLLLKYLKIKSCFIKLPTVREMQILLTLHSQPNRKKTAKLFNISSNTLASHLQNLKEKLITPDLNEVLMKLRKAPMNENTFNQICVPLKSASA